MVNINNQRVAVLVSVVIVVSASLFVSVILRKSVFKHNTDTISTGARFVEGEYATDYADDRKLVGAAHNVFVGKVLRQIDSKRRSVAAETQYDVDVIHNIKGNLQGTIIVDQFGTGYINGVFFAWGDQGDIGRRSDMGTVNPGEGLLHIGATYLFATRYADKEGWNTISVPPYDSKLVTANSSLNYDQLRSLAQADERVRELQQVYPDEILSEIDKRLHTTWNSYTSRHYDANGQLIDDTIEYAKQHQLPSPIQSTVPAADESAPVVSEQPAAKPETSIASTPTPGESVAPTETPVPTEATVMPVATEEPTPTPVPTDIPVQS